MEILIDKMQEIDKQGCLDLIENVVVAGFIEEGIDIQKEKKHLADELEIQRKRIDQNSSHYVVAKQHTNIIGMIAYLTPCEVVDMAVKELQLNPQSIYEIISLYVNPHFQRKGVGSLLFENILLQLKHNKVEYFAISTGYKKGRSFWSKKLGKESIIYPTYYSGWPCSVWLKKVDDIL